MAATRKQRVTTIEDLPADLLQQVFSHVPDFDPKLISLVSKQFLSVLNPTVRKLAITDSSSESHFQRLFRRFPCVKKIHVSSLKIDGALKAISSSDLALEKLQLWMFEYPMAVEYPGSDTMSKMSTSRVIRSVGSLQISWFLVGGADRKLVRARRMIDFVRLFPSLTELDFRYSFCWRNGGVESVTWKLPNLRRINLQDNRWLTDEIVAVLSLNCPNLESVNFEGCPNFTLDALHTFFRNNPRLVSVDLPRLPSASIPKMIECVRILKNVTHFSTGYGCVEDAVLQELAKSAPPLKSLILEYTFSPRYSMEGVSALLMACPGLERLTIDLPYSTGVRTQDRKMSEIVKELPSLKLISVQSRYPCLMTLFSLVWNCPLLETVRLARDPDPAKNMISVFPGAAGARPMKENYSIRSIEIRPQDNIARILLGAIHPYCPNLRK
uniref:F-box domain-containing protein n=1 Tax=Kalanchoe fedtschenkoi TaxID=63787 RepID=A0A7N0UZS1_KALFE